MLDRCKAIAARAELDPSRFDLKTFRSTYATRMLRSGFDVRTVQHWMGHKSLETTMRYLVPAADVHTRLDRLEVPDPDNDATLQRTSNSVRMRIYGPLRVGDATEATILGFSAAQLARFWLCRFEFKRAGAYLRGWAETLGIQFNLGWDTPYPLALLRRPMMVAEFCAKQSDHLLPRQRGQARGGGRRRLNRPTSPLGTFEPPSWPGVDGKPMRWHSGSSLGWPKNTANTAVVILSRSSVGFR
jgi:hypothetical protein